MVGRAVAQVPRSARFAPTAKEANEAMGKWMKPEAPLRIPSAIALNRGWGYALGKARIRARGALQGRKCGSEVVIEYGLKLDEIEHRLMLTFRHVGYNFGGPVTKLVLVVDRTAEEEIRRRDRECRRVAALLSQASHESSAAP
jgi:hypothetical protein